MSTPNGTRGTRSPESPIERGPHRDFTESLSHASHTDTERSTEPPTPASEARGVNVTESERLALAWVRRYRRPAAGLAPMSGSLPDGSEVGADGGDIPKNRCEERERKNDGNDDDDRPDSANRDALAAVRALRDIVVQADSTGWTGLEDRTSGPRRFIRHSGSLRQARRGRGPRFSPGDLLAAPPIPLCEEFSDGRNQP